MIQDVQQGIGFVLYNVHNLPTKMYYTNGDVVEYIYDANGNRVTKKVENDNILWNYAYGTNGNVEARIKNNGYPPTHIKHNLWGNDLLGIREYTSYYTTTDEKFYYLKDHLGSIKVRVDENGTVVGHDDYYPFGMAMNGRSGSTGTEEGYKFTGKERDIKTGLDYFGARYYDSKIGRWTSVDPLSEKYPSLNPYNYVANNPLIAIDPDGRGILYKGKYIDGYEARNLALNVINDFLAGKDSRIEFEADGSATLDNMMADIRDELGGNTYDMSGLNNGSVSFGDILTLHTTNGKVFERRQFYANTSVAKGKQLNYRGVSTVGRTPDGELVLQLDFSIKSDNSNFINYPAFRYVGTLKEIFAILKKSNINTRGDLKTMENYMLEEKMNRNQNREFDIENEHNGRKPMLDASGEPFTY